jgi:RNA polymerase-binding transcription factor DksA
MNKQLQAELADVLQKQRRALLEKRSADESSFDNLLDTRDNEMEEHAQAERIAQTLDTFEERGVQELRDIDAALARIEAGTYGKCENCGGEIEEERLRALPTATLCTKCANDLKEHDAGDQEQSAGLAEEAPQRAELPPDLALLDDDELRERLMEIIKEDGQVDTEELQINTRSGVVFLEGAVPSEVEHEILLNILTDVAGVQEVQDNLEVERLAWEREDRWKEEAVQDVEPGTIPDKEPYAGTEDPVLSEEEGVTYEPPVNPPPPIRKV